MIGLRTGQILDRISRLVGLAGPRRNARAVRPVPPSWKPDPQLTVDFAGGVLTISGIGEGIGAEHLWRAAVAAADDRTIDVIDRFELFGAAGGVILGGGWLHDPAVEAATHRRFPSAVRTRFGEPGAVGAACMAGIAPACSTARSPAPG